VYVSLTLRCKMPTADVTSLLTASASAARVLQMLIATHIRISLQVFQFFSKFVEYLRSPLCSPAPLRTVPHTQQTCSTVQRTSAAVTCREKQLTKGRWKERLRNLKRFPPEFWLWFMNHFTDRQLEALIRAGDDQTWGWRSLRPHSCVGGSSRHVCLSGVAQTWRQTLVYHVS
jgi:hypothetical protein